MKHIFPNVSRMPNSPQIQTFCRSVKPSMAINKEGHDDKRACYLTLCVRDCQLGTLGGLRGKCLMENARLTFVMCTFSGQRVCKLHQTHKVICVHQPFLLPLL